MKHQPDIQVSVITVNLNNQSGLANTLKSVQEQDYPFIQHVVIDGASTDGSVDLLKDIKNSKFVFISEKDNGVYDAQNKGINLAKGQFLAFLNSGDVFYSNRVVSLFVDNQLQNSEGLVYGNSEITDSKGKTQVLTPPSKINSFFWYRNTLNHQAVFFSKKLFEQFGLYNTNYRLCADFDFLLKVYKSNPKLFSYLNNCICRYQETGISANPDNYSLVIEEREKILATYFSDFEIENMRNEYKKTLGLRERWRLWLQDNPGVYKLYKKINSR